MFHCCILLLMSLFWTSVDSRLLFYGQFFLFHLILHWWVYQLQSRFLGSMNCNLMTHSALYKHLLAIIGTCTVNCEWQILYGRFLLLTLKILPHVSTIWGRDNQFRIMTVSFQSVCNAVSVVIIMTNRHKRHRTTSMGVWSVYIAVICYQCQFWCLVISCIIHYSVSASVSIQKTG